MKNTLEKLYNEHKGKTSDKWSLYVREYNRIFEEFREKPVSLLEIGIQNGGSLEIWSKYFENHEVLVGCDINNDCGKLRYDNQRIRVIVGDANSSKTKREITNISDKYDIVIDDGSHTSGDIIKAFANYFPIIREDGIFVAEDLHCSYWKEYDGGLYDPGSSISFFKLLADITNHEHWGVQKRRSEILNYISRKYEVIFREDSLKEIHSIEFINSMVVIRKAETLKNILGPRTIAGGEEIVVGGHKELDKKEQVSPEQTNNPYSGKDPGKCLSECEKEIASLKSSLSWKITLPLRVLNDIARKILARNKKKVRIQNKTRNEYQEWIHKYDILDSKKKSEIRYKLENLSSTPLISVLMPCYNSDEKFLKKAIESVINQLYPYWELCMVDDASTDPRIRKTLEFYASKDKRIKVAFRDRNGHISEASNTALSIANGEWMAFLDHDDELSGNALYEVVCAINENPEVLLIYSDEDKIDERGNRYDPHFKSDWNPDLFLSQNYICHLTTIHKSVVDKIKGFRTGFEGSQDYDLILRCLHHLKHGQIHHIPKILYHWRAGSGSTARDSDAKNYTTKAGIKALKDYLEERGVNAEVEQGSFPNTYKVKYALPYTEPLVSIIIPTRDKLPLLEKCILSILSKTTYTNYEIIIVDNLSTQHETLSFFENIQRDQQNIKVIKYIGEFNYSAINNIAVKLCSGSIIALVNNDIEVISPDWLSEMVSHAVRPEIGCVGAKLFYSDGRIQHGGVILGIGGVAGHSHKNYQGNHPGYFSRLQLIQNLSAVTGACLLVKKSVFNEVGGLDEDNLTVAFNDVDFCMKVSELGYRNLWIPYAELIHHESISRGEENTPQKINRFNSEVDFMKMKWGEKLLSDPYYNPNLSNDHEDFRARKI